MTDALVSSVLQVHGVKEHGEGVTALDSSSSEAGQGALPARSGECR
jgi:hypothetical protein